MDRREFFRNSARKLAEVAIDEIEARAAHRASRWIRPPYALEELEFLLQCTRCGDCIEACPHQVVFSLSARLGAQVVGTPALDLLNRGCHLCADWPCVAACEPGALKLPEVEANAARPLPKMASAAIDTGTCLPYSGPECGACRNSCPVPGALVWESERPRIEEEPCTGCALCREACIVEPKAVTIRSNHRASSQPQGRQTASTS
jgi:ferredoxin-type protein NapG